MAKFLAYYNLCQIHDTKEFLGLSTDKDEGNIISTLGRNIIIILKLSTQKQIRSWTVLDKLSSKVVYDKKSQQYVGVFGNHHLRCWDEDTPDLNKIKKLKFNKYIADLVWSHETDEVLILYNDGSCESLSHALESRKEQKTALFHTPETQMPSICDAKIMTQSDGRKLLTYFEKSPKNNEMHLIRVELDEDTLKPISDAVRYKVDRRDQQVTLSGYTVMEGQGAPILLTVWSDKRLFTMSLSDEVSPSDVPGNFIAMIDFFNVEQSLSIIGLSKHWVAMYGANTGQEGASIVFYNIQFKVVKSKQFFKIFFNFSRLWTVENHILLAMGQNLSVVSFRISKELLSEMIGTQIGYNMESYVEDDFVNEEDFLEECLYFVNKPKNVVKQIEDVGGFSNIKMENYNRADGQTIPYAPYEIFENKLKTACSNNLHVDVLSTDKDNEDFNLYLMPNFNDDGFETEEIAIISKQLEKCGAGEQEISEKLLTVLLKADLPKDIAACLRRYTNISNKMLVRILDYALTDFNLNDLDTLAENCTTNDQTNETDIEMCSGEFPIADIYVKKTPKINVTNKSDLIPLVLSCSIDEAGLVWYIKKELDFKKATLLLEYLYYLVTRDDIQLEERPDNSIDFDDDSIIIQWFGMLLITHFQALALSRDKNIIDLLVKWSEFMNLYTNDLKDLQDLFSLLSNLVNKKLSSKDKKYSKWYSIEEVKLY